MTTVFTPGKGCEGRVKISFKNKILLFKGTLLSNTGWSRRPVPSVPFRDEEGTLFNRLQPISLGRNKYCFPFVPSRWWEKGTFPKHVMLRVRQNPLAHAEFVCRRADEAPTNAKWSFFPLSFRFQLQVSQWFLGSLTAVQLVQKYSPFTEPQS